MAHSEDIQAWFAGRVADEWFTETPTIRLDREEILVIGRLAPPKVADDATDDTVDAACGSRIAGFREDTRERRIRIAEEAEHRFARKVSWGATCGDVERIFTAAAVPVMTRLRMDERGVLDTLIDAGVARSRSEALAWCVKLVGEHEADWIAELREAIAEVDKIRDRKTG